MSTWKKIITRGDFISELKANPFKLFHTDNGGAIVELTHGAAGQVLTSGGATSAPSWATIDTYTHPTNDGNKHVPATGTTNNGKFLMAGSTAGSIYWANALTGISGNSPISVSGTTISHLDTAGNKHIPNAGANGQFLAYSGIAGQASWSNITGSDVVKTIATSTAEGKRGDISFLNNTDELYVCVMT